MAARKRFHHQEEGGEDEERWLLTYADMITLLMVFFIVMYSMARTDLQKFTQVARSLQTAFNVGAQPYAALVGSERADGSAQLVPPVVLQERPARQQGFLRVSAALAAFASEAGLEGQIAVNMNTEGVVISLSDALLFRSGSAELQEEAETTLHNVAQVLQTIDNPIRVEGHTDTAPTNDPRYPTNWELSVARAVSIVRHLSEEEGIAPERLSAAGYAHYRPLVPNDSREHRALNRRANIVIIYPNDSQQFAVEGDPTSRDKEEIGNDDGEEVRWNE